MKKLNVLITSGNTQIPIDNVRCISNIFKGNTGKTIANYLSNNDVNVTLLANDVTSVSSPKINPIIYKTYDELYKTLQTLIKSNQYDAIIHSAAVSDYKVDGTFISNTDGLVKLDQQDKISGDHQELYIKLIPTEKIIDKFRDWGFTGKLIKFKLQSNISDQKLIEIATKSKHHSNADLVVANCMEWAKERAIIIDNMTTTNIIRNDLPKTLLDFIKGN